MEDTEYITNKTQPGLHTYATLYTPKQSTRNSQKNYETAL
jgi:hypothetical protein